MTTPRPTSEATALAQDTAPGLAPPEAATDSRRPTALRAWARRRRSTHLALKGVVLVVGLAIVAAGLAMLVLPGPGWAALLLGLVVLASEFAWAERVLAPVRRSAHRGLTAVRRTRSGRVALVAVAILGVVVATAAGAVTLATLS